MKKTSLKTVAEKLKNIDLCMMITTDGRGSMHARPMSNNGQVEYDGDSWFFTFEGSNKVRQIEDHPKVSLIFSSKEQVFIECYGHATVTKQRSKLEEHWLDELKQWFPEGIDTPGICLIRVTASRIHFWHNEEEGEYAS